MERRTTSSSSGSSRPQDQYRKLHSKSWHRRGPERSLTIGDTPIEAVLKDPTLYSSLGWTRDAIHLMNWFLYNEGKDLSAERRAQIILRALAYMSQNMDEWLFEREQQPLWYMTYLTEVIKKADGPIFTTMRKYTLWIKPGSFYQLRIYQLKELKKCPHLMNLDPPKPDLEPPSMTSLRTHETTFKAARKNPQITQEAFEKARDKYADALKLHGCHATSATVRAMAPPRGLPTTGGGDALLSGSGPVRSQRESSSLEATSHTEEEDDPDQTTPMEVYPSHTGETARHSWSDRVDDEETWGQQSSRHNKQRQGTSEYKGDARTVPPFVFSDEARVIAVEKLFNEARTSLSAQSAWIRLTLYHNIPASQCSDQGIVQLTNLLLVCVNEYHLTRSIRGCGPLFPPEIERWLRDLKEYLPHDEAGFPSTDVWEKDKGNLLRLACWLHRLDMAFTYSRGTTQSHRREDHAEIGSLLRFLLGPQSRASHLSRCDRKGVAGEPRRHPQTARRSSKWPQVRSGEASSVGKGDR